MNEETKEKKTGFDLIVTHRDEKTGAVIRKDPYILRVCGKPGTDARERYWERPAGSGNLWDKKGQPAGRWDKSKPEGERFIKGAQHTAWEAPLTQDQKIAKENAALKAELAALKAEQDKKQPTQTQKKPGA